MLALYRKYRPQKLSEICGQNHIKVTLQSELASGKVAHAYVFSGPRGTGKTTTARILAKALNCEKRKTGEVDACGKCESCVSIAEGKALDVIEIDAASHTGVDNVRENIIQNAKYSPSSARYKIFIIDEVHMLSLSAFNALLKTLEEPPAQTYFILATTELYKVPETILSRCQRFDFRRVSIEDILERLNFIAKKEKITVENEVLELVARRGEGSVRDAESIFGQILAMHEKNITLEMARMVIPYSDAKLVIEFLHFLSSNNAQGAIQFVNKIVYQGIDLERFTDDCIEGLRKILLVRVGADAIETGFNLPKDQVEEFKKLSQGLTQERIVDMIEILLQRRSELKDSPITQLPLEIAIIDICQKTQTLPAEIVKNHEPFIPKSTPSIAKNQTVNAQKIEKEDKKIENKPQPKKQSNTPPMPATEVLQKIKESWPQILEGVKKHNHTLFSFFQIIQPVEVRENTLFLGVTYAFHKERIDEFKNKMAIEAVILDSTGYEVKIESIIQERKTLGLNEDQRELEALAQEFGGSVTE